MQIDIRETSTDIKIANIKAMLNKHWPWLLGLGILLVLLGTTSILLATLTTLISVVVFGVFLLIIGAVVIYQAIKIYWHHWDKYFLQLGMGVLYILVGILFITRPVHGAISLTLLIAIFYIIAGAYRSVVAMTHRTSSWGWLLFSGLVTFGLGLFILFLWPQASLWVIGIFIGVDMLFFGWAFIISALSARKNLAS